LPLERRKRRRRRRRKEEDFRREISVARELILFAAL